MEKSKLVVGLFFLFPYPEFDEPIPKILDINGNRTVFQRKGMEKFHFKGRMENLLKRRRGALLLKWKNQTPVTSLIRSSTSILNIESEVYLRSICSKEAWIVA